MRLTDRVHLVASGSSGFDLSDEWDAHAYLIDGDGEAALIDAGCGQDPDAVLADIAATGVAPEAVRTVLVTHGHPDHAGGAAGLAEQLPSVEVTASPEVAGWLRTADERAVSVDVGKRSGFYPPDFRLSACRVAREVRDGDTVAVGDLSVRVLATPGHADGHLSFLLEEPVRDDGTRGRRVLFSGDCLFWGGRVSVLATPDCRLGPYRESLKRLEGLGVDALLPGHHQISLWRGQRHIDTANRLLANGFMPPSLV